MTCYLAASFLCKNQSILLSPAKLALNSNEVLGVLIRTPEAVQKMSADVEGLVQTSLNMGILYTEDDKVTLKYCVRSSVDAEKIDLINQLKEITESVGGSVITNGVYPGW